MKKLLLTTLLFAFATTQVFAQAPSQELPTTNILVTVMFKPEARELENFGEMMQNEVRDTVKLYLAGMISQWYFRGDGGGVVFVLNAKSVEEAKTAIHTLPFASRDLIIDEYIPLSPMAPLGMLIAPPM
ncbi:MAG: hypothetical protein HOJ34_03305 [Kordiimonadaceae bacterium]|nr:hypothetical protein [Kordiimonadaceae bacterium]MBT6328788.1 hypothetical protein [Kordiimonadaceae bacterium]MBT7583135.1 hypothetical protein [Kordiimonadaceae bacterium]